MTTANREIHRFLKHSSIYTIGNVVNRLGAFLLLPVYTNYLTVAEYGALELFYTVSAVISGFLSIGIAHATLRFYFEYDDERDRNTIVSTNLVASLVISLAGISLVAVWHRELSQFVFGNDEYSRGFLIILATLVLELASQVCLAYLRAKEYSMFFVGIAVAKLIIQVVTNAYLLIYQHAGVDGVLAGNLAAVAAGWFILAAFTLRCCGMTLEFGKIIPVLKYSFPFLLTTMVALVSANVDRLLISSILSLEALGIYALALRFSRLINDLIGEPFNRAYGSFRFSIMKHENAATIQARIVRYLIAGSVIAGLGIVYFTKDLLAVMSKESFWPAADILPLLVLASVVNVASYPLQTGILYEKKTRYIFYIRVTQALLCVVANILLINWMGVNGACLAVLLTSLTELYQTNRISQRFFRVEYEHRRILTIILLAVGFYALALPLAGMPLLISVPAKLALMLVFILALLKSPAFDKDEIIYARTFVRQKLLRQSA